MSLMSLANLLDTSDRDLVHRRTSHFTPLFRRKAEAVAQALAQGVNPLTTVWHEGNTSFFCSRDDLVRCYALWQTPPYANVPAVKRKPRKEGQA